MRDPFNERKATQAASRFLRLSDGRMNYTILIKLLYLLERFALQRWGRKVFFDDYCSMHKGPVVKHVKELITDMPWPGDENIWTSYISPPSNYEVSLVAGRDIGNDELSEAEEELIDEIFKQYGHYSWDELVNQIMHDLPEWDSTVQPGNSIPLAERSILVAGNKSADQIAAIEGDLECLKAVDSFLVHPSIVR
jgi:uncharacterized phage-associated protein